LIVPPKNKAAAKTEFADKGFRVVTGHRYLGRFIGDQANLDTWLEQKVSDWELPVKDLAGVTTRYPQTAYTGLPKSLQNEWQFVQRVKPGCWIMQKMWARTAGQKLCANACAVGARNSKRLMKTFSRLSNAFV
jgi:hypothetical protein